MQVGTEDNSQAESHLLKSFKLLSMTETHHQIIFSLILKENQLHLTQYAYPVDSGCMSGKLTRWRGQLFLKP